MTQSAAILTIKQKQNSYHFFAPTVVLLIAANIAADYLYTVFQQTAFYLSESALFSSYWVLFLPMLLLQRRWTSRVEKKYQQLSITILIMAMHLVSYPALIGLLSALFYDHTFAYGQSFQFGISAYLVESLVIYGYSFVAAAFQSQPQSQQPFIETIATDVPVKEIEPLQTLLVSDGPNTQTQLPVNDIFYFSANPPYVMIHLGHKKFLHTATLKGLEAELDAHTFVRIHKSCLLNINTVASIQSRKNGDYDVTLTDETVLRVSRNYAQHFKLQWLGRPQVSLK